MDEMIKTIVLNSYKCYNCKEKCYKNVKFGGFT